MTEILCSWLNNGAKVSKKIDIAHFANEFSSGYLIGELLHKYGLQEDFDQFTPTTASNSKLNNFSRLEPTIHLLDIPFDTVVARDIMDAKPGAAAKLVYELFIALTKKEQSGLTGTAMETMRPKAPAKLFALAGVVYRDEMYRKVPRESTLQLERISQTYTDRQKNFEQFQFKERLEEDERRRNAVADAQEKESHERKKRQALQAELFARLRAAKYDVSDFVPTQAQLSEGERLNVKRLRELRSAMNHIETFEKRLEETRPVVAMSDVELVAYIKRNQQLQEMGLEADEMMGPDVDLDAVMQKQKAAADNVNDYMTRIKRRLAEERAARVEREKRRRKVLLDQLRAREQQEEERREQLLLHRLLRRSQQERRIAAQLLAVRHEKDIIRENRTAVQKTFAEAREAEFRAALEQNAAMCRLKDAEDEAILAEAKRTHNILMEERQKAKFEKHYAACWEIFQSVIDVGCRFAEYRQMTNKKPVPLGLANEWKRLFVSGLPVYESQSLTDLPVEDVKPISEIVPPQLLSGNALQLLDQLDFSDYLSGEGLWKPFEEGQEIELKEAPMPDPPVEKQPINRVLRHVTDKLVATAYPPPPKPKIEALPPLRLLATLVGKPFAGTTSVCLELAKDDRVKVFSLGDMVDAAMRLGEELDEELAPEEMSIQPAPQLEQSEPGTNATMEQGAAPVPPPAEDQQKPPEVPAPAPEIAANQGADPGAPPPPPPVDEKVVFKRKRRELARQLVLQIKTGQPIPTDLLAQLVVDELRLIPEEESKTQIVIIGGFPATLNEARLFQAVASGFDIAADEQTAGIPQAPVSRPKFVDLSLVLDCPDEICLARNANIPPDQMTNPNGQGLEQRLVWFTERWPEVESYLVKNGVKIQQIDASQPLEDVCFSTLFAIDNRIAELEAPPPEPEIPPPPPEPEPVPVEQVVEPPPPTPPPPTPPPATVAPAKKGRGKSPKGSPRKASKSPPRSPKGKKGGKKTPEPEPPPPAPVVPAAPPGPTPDMPEWVFVDQPITQEITIVLADIWRSTTTTYTFDCQKALRGIRLEREQLIRFLYRIRVDLAMMLQQPDTKRDFVAVFCRDFNGAISGEIRAVDEETKAELHQRCDDLRDRLWAICERKRAAAEKRRVDIASSGWLEERIGIVLNHLIRLMQAEIDRFHSAVCMMRDYYRAMETPIPENYIHPAVKLPLYQLPSEESLLAELGVETASPNPVEQQPSQGQISTTSQPARPDSRSRSKKSRSPKPSVEPPEATTVSAAPAPSAAPVNLEIIPRRSRELQPTAAALPEWMVGDNKKRKTSAGKRAADKKGKGKQDAITALTEARRVEPSTQLPTDLELRLLHDSWWGAFSAVHNLSTLEQLMTEKERELAEEARNAMLSERAAAAAGAAVEKEKEKEKEKKKGAAKGKRSPSPQKGRSPSPKPAAAQADLESGETPAEKEKRLAKENMRQEFLYEVQADEKALKQRLEMIRARGQMLIEEMKRASASSLDSMTEMAGQRFLFEMTAVDQLLGYMRNCIERSSPLNADLILDGDKFWALFGDEQTQTGRHSRLLSTIPIPQPTMESLIGMPTASITEPSSLTDVPHPFAIPQLYTLHQQFARFAPSGVMEIRAFEELVRDVGSDLFAPSTNAPLGGPTGAKRQLLSPSAVAELGQLVAVDGDFADWRLLLLCLAHPWPIPTRSDIVQMLIRFRDMDQRRLSSLSRPQYNRVELWFSGSPIEPAFSSKDVNAAQRPPSARDLVRGSAIAQQQPPIALEPPGQSDSRLQQFRDFLFDIFSEIPSGTDLPSHLQQPRIDYVTMLSYVARVPDGTDSLVRMLSLALADHITNAKSAKGNGGARNQPQQQEAWQSAVLRQAADVSREGLRVPIEPLFRVLSTHIRMRASHSRVGDAAAKEERVVKEKLINVYAELNSARGSDDSVPLGILLKHPVTEEILASAAANFRAPHPKSVFRVFQEMEKDM